MKRAKVLLCMVLSLLMLVDYTVFQPAPAFGKIDKKSALIGGAVGVAAGAGIALAAPAIGSAIAGAGGIGGIGAAIVGGVQYKGAWTITPSTTDFSGITLPVKQGYMYYVAGEGPVEVDGIEWNVGDYLLVNQDVAVGGSLAGKVEKIDNTELVETLKALGYKANDINKVLPHVNKGNALEQQVKEALKLLLK